MRSSSTGCLPVEEKKFDKYSCEQSKHGQPLAKKEGL